MTPSFTRYLRVGFFVLVFGCYIYLTLGSLCFSIDIGTAHYSILQFPVFFLSTCLHLLLVLCTPGCNITSFRWTQPCWALHLRLMLQLGQIIKCLSLLCSGVGSFWCKLYFVKTASLELYLFLAGLGICAAWASSCVWIALCY